MLELLVIDAEPANIFPARFFPKLKVQPLPDFQNSNRVAAAAPEALHRQFL